jgi:nitronate monooxygenase
VAQNRLTDLLAIEHPIVLAPFGGVSSVGLTALVSELGGLGSYGLYGYSPDRISATITELSAATARPFAVNLWLPTGQEVTPDGVDLTAAIEAVAALFSDLGLAPPQPPAAFLPDFEAQIDAVLEAVPAAVSFVFGAPPPELVDTLHERGIRVLGTATTVEEAVALEAVGLDAVVATGAEAGGHRVSFLRPPQHSLVGTVALVPQVVDAVRVPVIAAGGIADRRGVAAAFALGASGALVGTAFLRTEQSAAPPAHREAIARAGAADTALTRAMSGRLARGIPNRAVEVIEAANAIAAFPAQNWLTGLFRAEAARRNNAELLSLWAGQAAALATRADAADVFTELCAGLPD